VNSDSIIGIIGVVVSIIGIIVGAIGAKNLSVANRIKNAAKNNNDSLIQSANY